jgi:hypothetical protein
MRPPYASFVSLCVLHKDDPAEMHDLSAKYPEKRDAMLKLWYEYMKRNCVIVSEAGPFAQQHP